MWGNFLQAEDGRKKGCRERNESNNIINKKKAAEVPLSKQLFY